MHLSARRHFDIKHSSLKHSSVPNNNRKKKNHKCHITCPINFPLRSAQCLPQKPLSQSFYLSNNRGKSYHAITASPAREIHPTKTTTTWCSRDIHDPSGYVAQTVCQFLVFHAFGKILSALFMFGREFPLHVTQFYVVFFQIIFFVLQKNICFDYLQSGDIFWHKLQNPLKHYLQQDFQPTFPFFNQKDSRLCPGL